MLHPHEVLEEFELLDLSLFLVKIESHSPLSNAVIIDQILYVCLCVLGMYVVYTDLVGHVPTSCRKSSRCSN